MKLRIRLRRSLAVRCWRVVGRVAKAAKRPELIPLLVRVRDQGWSSADDIATHLLFEPQSRKVVADRLLRIAATYRLLDEHRGRYTLTEQGRLVIESEQVFVPEHGTWTFWASEDPLLGSRVLRVDAWQEPSAYDEVWGKERNTKRSFERLPPWLTEVVGKVQRPCAGAGHSLRIDELETQGEVVSAEANLAVEWAVEDGRLRVTGSLGGSRVSTDLQPPAHSHTEVWQELLEHGGFWPSWDPATEALRVGFDDTAEAERESMTRNLRFERPHLEGLGLFEATAVSGVSLAALSQDDAERWVRWRLESRIRDYATERRMADWAAAAKEPFTNHSVRLPTRSDLAREAWGTRGSRPSPRTWHLVAAEDWRLR